MAHSKHDRSVRRAVQKAVHQNTKKLSSSIAYIEELLKKKNIHPGYYSPIMKNYKNMIVDKTTNRESTINTIIIPGCESLLPGGIHPKEVRLVIFSGYHSNMNPDDDEFQDWFNSFDYRYIMEWIDEIIYSNKLQKKYRDKPSKYRRNTYNSEPGYGYQYDRLATNYCSRGCMKCRQADPSKMSHAKFAKNQRINAQISRDIKDMSSTCWAEKNKNHSWYIY